MLNPSNKHLTVSVQFAAVLLGATSLHASVIALEDFEDKTLAALNGQGGGSGFTGNWSADGVVTVVNSSLSYSNGAVGSTGGSQALQFLWSTDETITDGILSRQLGASQNGTVYMSMLFRDIANNDPFTLGNPNDFVQWGFDSSSDGNPNATILRRNGELQARSNTTTNPNSVGSGEVSILNQTRFLVLKATRGAGNYNSISLFVDPSTLTETGASPPSNFDSGINIFSHFVARSAFHEANDSFLIDNIRIGTTWEDVVTALPAPPPAIPEPSSVLLGLLTSLALLRRRR